MEGEGGFFQEGENNISAMQDQVIEYNADSSVVDFDDSTSIISMQHNVQRRTNTFSKLQSIVGDDNYKRLDNAYQAQDKAKKGLDFGPEPNHPFIA